MSSQKQHITIHDIAKEMGISGSTVSRALNNHPRISKETKEAVAKLAAKYNYRPNSMAASLRKGEGNTIGVIVPKINRSFFANIIWGMEDVLSRSGYNLMICQSNEELEKEKAAIKTLQNARVEAIMMSLSMETTEYDHIQNLLDDGVRMVFFDRIPDNLNVHSVVIDDYKAAFSITKHVLEQGYKRLAHIGGSEDINVYAKRKEGFYDAVRAAGLMPEQKFMIQEEMTKAGGERAFQLLMTFNERPDAIICSGDFAALGVILAAREAGIKVPEELGVTGFANEDFTGYITPPLTTVFQKGVEIGRIAAEEILGMDENGEKKTIIIDPEIKIRESSVRK